MKRICILLVALVVSSTVLSQSKIDTYIKADSLISVNKQDDAEEYLVHLSRDNPHNGDYYFSLGEIFYKKGEFRKSVLNFLKAQECGLEYKSNYYLAGNYMGINKPDSALYYLKKHIVTPMNGYFVCNEALYDTIFQGLHDFPGYIKLLPPKIVDSTDIAKNWIKDIEYLSMMLKKTHYDPFCKLSESDWDAKIEQLKKDVSFLNNDQILVRIYQFVALIGDGHTRIMPNTYKFPGNTLPIRTQMFSDGCYIISASDGYTELLGAKIVKVNNYDFKSVYDSLSSTIAIDNEMGYKLLFGWNFHNINLLHGLGISNSTDSLEIVYLKDDVESRMVIHSEKNEKKSELIQYHTYHNTKYPMFLENYHSGSLKWYWCNYLEEENILYVQINGITSIDTNPLPEFCDSVTSLIDSLDVSAFVLDIRNNGGGNTNLNINLLEVLLSKKINIQGKSFTIIGCNTFSAAQNLTNIIEKYTQTIFIGERTSSKPSFIGEVNPFALPYSGLMVSSSNIYHQYGYSTDTRKWTAPDIYVEFDFEHFKNGTDPVMEEIIKFTSK